MRSIEESDDLQLLEGPYVYRTVRIIGGRIERASDEIESLRSAYTALWGDTPNINEKQLEQAAERVMTRNLYMGRSANAEIRLYSHNGEATVWVSSGELLDSDRYECAVIRPSAQTLPYEIPYIEHHTSILRQTLALHRNNARQVKLLCRDGAVVSCEGFPLYGVIDDHIICYTPWSSPESRRAEEIFAKYGKPFKKGVFNLENGPQPEELFTLTTNRLVSLSHINGRALFPFVSYALDRALTR